MGELRQFREKISFLNYKDDPCNDYDISTKKRNKTMNSSLNHIAVLTSPQHKVVLVEPPKVFTSTYQYLHEGVKNMYIIYFTVCAAKECRTSKNTRMHLCLGCHQWFHIVCQASNSRGRKKLNLNLSSNFTCSLFEFFVNTYCIFHLLQTY